jgi:hypothetical protein
MTETGIDPLAGGTVDANSNCYFSVADLVANASTLTTDYNHLSLTVTVTAPSDSVDVSGFTYLSADNFMPLDVFKGQTHNYYDGANTQTETHWE